MKMPTRGHRGHLMAWMHGFSSHRRITIAATYITCLKRKVTAFLAELFPQHCIAPAFTPVTHVQELSTELQETLATMGRNKRTFAVLKTLAQHLDAHVSGTTPPQIEQRMKQQRGMDIAPHELSPGIQRVTNAQGTTMANNPTFTRVLQTKARTHLRNT
jgi:hypothetical protein